MSEPTDTQIDLYATLFRGRPDIYARYWEKNGRSGYSPAYSFNWNEFLTHKQKGGSIKTFENKKAIPLTKEIIKQHLLGQIALGIYPMLEDNTSFFLAADFDGERWQEDAQKYIYECEKMGLSAYLERSKSGTGGHVWIFFQEPYPCYKNRRIGLELVRRAFNISEFEKEVSFDRLFPNQDALPDGGFGNLIALPLQGRYAGQHNTLFINPKTAEPYDNQWKYLEQIRRHGTDELNIALATLDSSYTGRSNENMRGENANQALSIHVGKQIEIPRRYLASSTIKFLKEKLNFLNTEYLTKKRLGKSVYRVQKYFKLISESSDSIFLPRGFLNQFASFLKSKDVPFEIQYAYPDIKPSIFKNLMQLTPSQQEAAQKSLDYDGGVIVAPPGSGKTMIGMEIIANRQLPALVLVHRKQLLDQWVDRIQIYLDIPKIRIGRFSGTTKKIGKDITVGLLQSFARHKNLSELSDTFGTIIIDECHHIPAKTFREVIANLNPRYLYGLTATPKRKHNDEQLIFVYIGDIIATMDAGVSHDTSNENAVKMPQIIIQETELEIPFQWKTDRFQLLAKIISFDTARNRLIANDIIQQVKDGNKTLVLSERKEHLEILALCLKGHAETIIISGDNSARERDSKLKQIRDGHYQVILSTGQFFGEGLDVKNISTLILAFPFSFEGKLAQYIGRLLHSTNPKFVFDYRDGKVAFLERQYKQRQRYYKKNQ